MNECLTSLLFALQVDLLDYIVENRERLIPIFGSEFALGGPNIPDIYGKYPIHVAADLRVVQFLHHHGADLWVLDADGLSAPFCLCDSEAVKYLVSLPSFDPNFIYPNGLSHIELALVKTKNDFGVQSLAVLDILLKRYATETQQHALESIEEPHTQENCNSASPLHKLTLDQLKKIVRASRYIPPFFLLSFSHVYFLFCFSRWITFTFIFKETPSSVPKNSRFLRGSSIDLLRIFSLSS